MIFNNEIPDPRDIIIISLINTCAVFRFIFQLDDESEERIELVCRLDLIGRAIAEAVTQNLAGPLIRRSALTKPIPTVPLRKVLFNRQLRSGRLPALFAELATAHGPIFQVRPPFQKPLTFLAGPETNHWAHRQGRMYLRTKDYLQDFEKVYGAAGILPALDGADHFRFRKSMAPAYSRARLEGQLERLYASTRTQMSTWQVGESIPAGIMCRELINAELSPCALSLSER